MDTHKSVGLGHSYGIPEHCARRESQSRNQARPEINKARVLSVERRKRTLKLPSKCVARAQYIFSILFYMEKLKEV